MTVTLRISESVTLPLKMLELRSVTLGSSGAGKTSGGRVLYEEAVAAGVVTGAIDLKGDWWGLKSTADGKSAGIPVVIFGGDHADLPLDEHGGAALAEIVVDLRQPFVVDLELLSRNKQCTFLAAFFDRLYDVNREPLVLFCDEVDRYAPQNPISKGSSVLSLAATEDLAKRGRKHGIFPQFTSQRNASVNKNVVELCDVAFVYRTSGPNDQAAVEHWFKTKATSAQLAIVKPLMAGLDTGTAVVCSAHPHLRMFETVPFREPWTFDSSATPEIGKKGRLQPRVLAKPDLEAIRAKMAETIERAKADDPRELRKRIAELERAAQKPALPAVDLSNVKAEAVREARAEWTGRIKALEDRLRAAQGVITRVTRLHERVTGELAAADDSAVIALPVMTSPARVEAPTTRHARAVTRDGDASIGKGERAILTVLAQYPHGKNRRAVGTLAGYSSSGGSFGTYISRLRTKGYIEGSDPLQITDGGREALGEFDPLPRGSGLVSYWLQRLGKGEAAILRVLVDRHPSTLSREDLGRAAGYEASGGSFGTYLSRLRTKELLHPTELRASDAFFE